MNDEQWRRLRALFNHVQEMTEAERAALVDRELRDEPELRAELLALLAADASAGSFLRGDEGGATPGGADRLAPGSTIGPYELISVLGEGGFGVVYLAEQLRPLRRRVALKLIKPGMDTKQVIARFAAERQAMALMDHPGIAQVFDAGETDAGRPYFVMEYVAGVPITAYCDQKRLRIRERLDLFLKVCDAVQHAHQKGVIHRDIKPSNVLVAERDGIASPKVIDFGIVKAAGAPIDEQSFATREGSILGTLGYMSPEQAGAAGAELDTRSDIYSLGVLLYELLAGELPFARARLRRAAWDEALRIIREEDPPALAARAAGAGATVETSASRLVEIAQGRSIDERSLLRELKGDLEWITLRAIEKNPNRRYASASEFSADIRRHLANEAVLARAPSAAYRVRKFARRHRVGVVAAALVLASIVSGGIAAGVGFGRAVRAEREARREAASAQRVAEFLVDVFQTSDPNRSRGETITARTLLDRGARRARVALERDPLVRARLLTTLGNAHVSLGLYDEGIDLLRDALAIAEAAAPRDEIEVATQLSQLAGGLRAAGRTGDVEALVDRAIALAESSPDAPPSLVAACLWQKASWLNVMNRLDAADSLVTRAIALCEAQASPDTVQLVRMYLTKAMIPHRQYRLAAAETLYLHALALAETSGVDLTSAMSLHQQLAAVYRTKGDAAQAVAHAQEGVLLARQLYAPDHPGIAVALGGQAAALYSEGENERAVAARGEAIEILRANGERDDLLAVALNSQGLLYRVMQRVDLAIPLTKEAHDINRRLYGGENVRVAETGANLARCFADSGLWDAADTAYREGLAIYRRLGDETFYAAWAFVGHGNVCRELGRLDEADSLYAGALALMDTSEASLRPYVIECLAEQGYLRARQGRHADAEGLARAWLAIAERDSAVYHVDRRRAHVLRAAARARAGDAEGAIESLENAIQCGGLDFDEVGAFPEIVALDSRPDYPEELRDPGVRD
ncbi:MAG: protein kinase domain-containing protein [bacterium]